MKVTKVINNSFVCAYDTNNKEVVVMGKGLGFRAKEGDIIDKKCIENIFVMNSKYTIDKFK